MTPITTLPQLNQLMNSTMIYAVVVGFIAVLAALLLANIFPWEGGKDRVGSRGQGQVPWLCVWCGKRQMPSAASCQVQSQDACQTQRADKQKQWMGI